LELALLIVEAERVRGLDLKSWGKETIKRRNPIMAAQRVVVCQGRINVCIYIYIFIYLFQSDRALTICWNERVHRTKHKTLMCRK